ncbi:S8 family serine peptidase [Ornithinimicrobium cerasi]|uniref:PA domain-containing protein n=1 Tax=Ornithinimicrobium cerasi TaxID=2248773 RepID=A0A285VW63_9MICO|nr:S8 family serine peptidase [Ornithinimicrobium cerasi]SOC56871.1 PA domain-containing protein [Ornithinimicrobium cerasi]
MGQTSPRRGVRTIALAAAVTVASPLALSATAAPQLQEDQSRKTYIVQLAADPIATYEGGTAGIAATKPAPGQKVKAGSANAKKYEAHLRNEQAKALKSAGVKADRKTHEFTVALNGFTADLTAAEAAHLAKAKGVVNVWEDETRHADTVTTPDYLGMTGKTGVWQQQFGGDENAGKGIVVGVIDTGIDPGNPSFASIGAPAPEGAFECETENDPAFTCSDKIVGARWYGAEFGNNVNFDFKSPRDTNGHGSHTAGTAAGNHGVPMSIQGYDLGEGSGMAPAAQVAVYKALWQTAAGTGSGQTSGLVAAIDDAVADGVDVINYSVSGSSTYVVTADELAFFGAAEAGVFVATSAGNSGDTVGVSSVAHNSPWTMTVAASTHNRGAVKTVTLGDGSVYEGVGIGDAVGPAPLVLAKDVALPGVSETAARECWLDANTATAGQQPSLDPAQVAGKIVICDRGTVDRVHKSAAVKLAGGIGMIQTNVNDAQSLNADFHTLPSIHVNGTDGAAIKVYEASAAAPTATISAMSTDPVNAPVMAGFSSYGPALAGGGDLLKPDITAPGVDVAAAYHQDRTTGEPTFNSISGTSMSAPHIAGLGALLKDKYPTWSPMAIKSAMMTTARQTDDEGQPIQWSQGDATPLNYGAGEVQPGRSYNPGLVYDSTSTDWYAYACAIGQLQLVGGAGICGQVPEIDPSDLNYPSIAVGDLAGKQIITRTVTNVTKQAMQYRAQVEAPAGTTVTVSPSKMTLTPGAKATYKVTITRTTAPIGEYTFGALTWAPNSPKFNAVRSPIAIRPVALAAPGEVVGSGTAGTTEISVIPGFAGTLGTEVDGLLASSGGTVTVNPRAGLQDAAFFHEVPAGTKVVRVATFSDEVTASDIDLNFYRYDAAANTISLVASSGNGDSTEEVTVRDLAPGRYYVALDNYSGEPGATARVHLWNLGDKAEGNLTVSPASVAVTQGTATTVTAAWNGLDATKRYLGQVNFLEGSTVAGSTLVTVNP